MFHITLWTACSPRLVLLQHLEKKATLQFKSTKASLSLTEYHAHVQYPVHVQGEGD